MMFKQYVDHLINLERVAYIKLADKDDGEVAEDTLTFHFHNGEELSFSGERSTVLDGESEPATTFSYLRNRLGRL